MKLAIYMMISLLTVSAAFAQAQATPPQAEISNGIVRAKLYLPNTVNGYYRGTRFDWSGVVGDLEYGGHRYYAPWFTRTDPNVRDFIYDGPDIVAGPASAITGPVEEFAPALGYEEAKPGGVFVKMGVGVLRKPDNANYDAYKAYDLIDPGKWKVRKSKDSVEFTQEILDPGSGYGYRYRKTVMLVKGKPEMVIGHSLKNIGKLPIQSSVYDHNFLVLDNQPPSPSYTMTFPFQVVTDEHLDKSLAEVRGNQIVYLQTLQGKDRVHTSIKGFSGSPDDYRVRIENTKADAGMTITGDRPLYKMALWSIRSVLAVEPFINISVEPGTEFQWKYTYSYYTLSHSEKSAAGSRPPGSQSASRLVEIHTRTPR